MKTTRAKFTCQSIKNDAYGNQTVELTPVYSGNPEDNGFNKATPSGKLEMKVCNPDAQSFFVPGSSYYLDFTPVPPAEPVRADLDAAKPQPGRFNA